MIVHTYVGTYEMNVKEFYTNENPTAGAMVEFINKGEVVFNHVLHVNQYLE
jgi:hypothetical protein